MFDFQVNEAPVREPSSGSVPDPAKAMLAVVKCVELFVGLAIDAVGGKPGVLTVMPTEAVSDAPWLSVAVSVIVWNPAVSGRLKFVPVPIVP